MGKDFNISKKVVLSSYIAQFFQYGSALFILPLILRNFPSSELGIWYVFLSIGTLISLLDLGFSQNILRNITYVFSGVQTLHREKYMSNASGSINFNLLASLINTSKKIYRIISIAVFLLFVFFGTYYLYYICGNEIEMNDILYPWIIFIISNVYNFYYTYLPVFVRGKGFIWEYNCITIISRVSYIFILVLFILLDFGLISLALANGVSGLINRELGRRAFYTKDIKFNLSKVDKSKLENLFSIIWYNSRKTAIVSFSVYLFTQSSVFLSGFFLNMTEVAQLGLTLQIFTLLLNASRIMFSTYYPKFSSLWIQGNVLEVKRLFLICMLIGYLIYFIGVVSVIFAGNDFLDMMGSQTLLPNTMVILLYGLFYLMEITHGNCSMLLESRNQIPFVKASVYSSIIAIILICLFAYLNLGIFSFPLAVVLTNIAYNSWKWPLEVKKILYV